MKHWTKNVSKGYGEPNRNLNYVRRVKQPGIIKAEQAGRLSNWNAPSEQVHTPVEN
jgi:hypothetical protein